MKVGLRKKDLNDIRKAKEEELSRAKKDKIEVALALCEVWETSEISGRRQPSTISQKY